MKTFLLFLLLSVSAHAELPVDIVFDIDLTIVSLINDRPGGDLLADPSDPTRNTVRIHHGEIDETYRVFEGMTELMEKLELEQKAGRVRVSFFSGGTEARNEALLKSIKLKNGTSLWDLAPGRVLGRSSMTPTGLKPPARIREQFKKDLTRINPDLSDVIIIDDIKEFVPESQRGNLLWIGEEFPFPDRTPFPPASVDPELLAREKYKFRWISGQIDRALSQRFTTGGALSSIIQNMSNAPVGCNTYRILSDLFTK
ncbi:MAG: hypothetical protein V4598_00195 [Bdellovibrionota bacterium]